MNLLYSLLLEAEIREGEAVPLERTDINTEAMTLKIQSKPKWGSRLKDYEQREVPLSDKLLARFAACKRDFAGAISLIFDKVGKLDGRLLRTLKQQVRAAGVNCGDREGYLQENTKRSRKCHVWYLHRFRATCATKLLRPHIDKRTDAWGSTSISGPSRSLWAIVTGHRR